MPSVIHAESSPLNLSISLEIAANRSKIALKLHKIAQNHSKLLRIAQNCLKIGGDWWSLVDFG